MPQIKEILRLHYELGFSGRKIARASGLSKSTVNEYLQRACLAGLTWPLPADMDDHAVEEQLALKPRVPNQFVLPDFSTIHLELKHKGVTLQLLWQDYKDAKGPLSSYGYAQYCHHYRQWAKKLKLSMRQAHKAGEKMFVDYSGLKVPIINRLTGETKSAEIFVAVMGASSYAYAEATWSQTLPDWIASHIRAFEYFGGVPELIVPDCLRSAVTLAHRYEPGMNEDYAEMAAYYSTALLPARPYKPQDKGKVEAGVQLVQRWILAKLRHHTFFSLAELNEAISKLLIEVNEKPFQKLEGSRASQFALLDKPVLKPLPLHRYEYGHWGKAKVHIDYHIEVEKHYYSVPYQLVGQKLDTRLSASVLEVFLDGKRVTSHPRAFTKYPPSTLPEHMPEAHQAHLEWSPSRFLNWAGNIGPHTVEVVDHLLTNRPHPQHGYRACLGLLRLAKRYSPARLETACTKAVAMKSPALRSIESMLQLGQESTPLPQEQQQDLSPSIIHPNLRGADYYQ